MARLIRSHDWGQTVLGAIDTWPDRFRSCVEIMLESAFPAYIWWGPSRIQLYNDAAIAIHRFRHPDVFATPARDCWAHLWNTLGVLADEATDSGRPALGEDLLLITEQRRSPEDGAWFTVSASPLRTEHGEIGGVLITMIETTRRIRAETRVRASEVRAKKLFQQAPGIVLVFQGADHVVEFTNDGANKLLGGRELPGRAARELGLEFTGTDFMKMLDAAYQGGARADGVGASVVLRRSTSLPGERLYLDFVLVPITDFIGTVTGTFFMGFDVTERVRAQRILRESADRQAFLLALSDALRPLADPLEIQTEAARVLGEHLRVSRAFYCDIEWDAGEACFVVHRDYHAPGVTSTAGRFRASLFGELILEVLEGRSIAICNVAEELELTDAERDAYFEVGAQAWCAAPIVKNGAGVAAFCVHEVRAREWEDHEMTLLEEAAERTWAAVERARAEAALREALTGTPISR